MEVIDFHSHILPGIDDGSRNTKESLAMVKLAGEQGVDRMLATPHFYASHHSIERFLSRRQHAWDKLRAAIEKERQGNTLKGQTGKIPQITLGAEVAFFNGISRAEEIGKLRIGETDLLLLEMPFGRWTDADFREVEELAKNSGMRIVLAHLERFLRISANRSMVYELLKLPLYVQVNAGSLLHWRTRRKTAGLLERKGIGLLGSDCHRIDERVPNLMEGRAVVKKMLGGLFCERMDELGERILYPVSFDITGSNMKPVYDMK